MAEGEGRGEGFLSRWSRLKQARREGSEDETRPAPAPAAAPHPAAAPLAEAPCPAPRPEATAEPEPEPEIDLASLPRIEDLTAGSDVAAFLRKGVPAALRNAALRRVWSVDPDIRDFIGPADYAWDWNVPGGAPGYAETIAHGPDVEALADRILGIGRETREPAPQEPEAVAEAPPQAQEDTAQPEVPALAPGAAVPVAAALPPTAPAAPPLPAAPLPASPPARPRHGGAVPA